MKRKTMLLAAAALSALAFAALPAVASAEVFTTPSFDLPAGTTFTSEGSEEGTLYAEGLPEVHCTSTTNEGEFENGMTGTATVTFHGCWAILPSISCQSGATAGTIATNQLTFHTVYLKPSDPENPHETPGILFTPGAGGVFASFECFGIPIVVKGNGVLGTLTSEINEKSNTTTIDVKAPEGIQQHTQVITTVTNEAEEYEETYATYGLEASGEGGEFVPAAEEAGSDVVTLEEGVEATLTTE